MVQYRVQDPEGNEHVIDGPEGATPDQVMAQAQALIPAKKGPEWSDLPGNVWEGIKETPETIKGIIKAPYQIGQAAGETLRMMTQPESVVPGVEGPSFGETPLGQMGKTIISDIGHAVTHPKETLIEHPISTVATIAPLVGAAGKAVGLGRAARVAGAAGEAGRAAGAAEEAAGAAKAAGAAGKAADPLAAVNEYITSKYGQAAAKPGWSETVAKYLKEESQKLGAKDLGFQTRQIQSAGPGLQGPERIGAVVDYARTKGYFEPSLGSIGRKELIKKNMETAGRQLEAIRDIADARGGPDPVVISNAVHAALEPTYASGSMKATGELKNVFDDIANVEPTFKGFSELATKLNRSATNARSLGQSPGPATDAANIISELNNKMIRAHLNPQEAELYTNSLRDYGAHKKIEQAVASAERRGMGARSNQRGILGRAWQEALDRAGYRFGSNIASRTAESILKNPQKVKTLPQFFEEFAHQAEDVLDEALGISE